MARIPTLRTEKLPALARERPLEMFGLSLVAAASVVSLVTWIGIRDVNNPAAQLPIITSGGLAAMGMFVIGSNLLLAGIFVRHLMERERWSEGSMTWYAAPENSEAARPMPDEVARRRRRVAERARVAFDENGRPRGQRPLHGRPPVPHDSS